MFAMKYFGKTDYINALVGQSHMSQFAYAVDYFGSPFSFCIFVCVWANDCYCCLKMIPHPTSK